MNIEARDIAIVIATLVGPFLAVYVSEFQRKKSDVRNRKIHIFRTLIATQTAHLTPIHVEALNLIGVEFVSSSSQLDRNVMSCWRMYLSHLGDRNYPRDIWDARRSELLVDLIHSISLALGFPYEKSQIKSDSYYPQGYVDAHNQDEQIRKLWLEVLNGNRSLPMKAEVFTTQNQESELV